MDVKQKYVRLKEYNQIIIFPQIIEHSAFSRWGVITAGFCYVDKNKVACFGKSISLGLEADTEEDTRFATQQLFGTQAMIDLIE